MSDAETGVEQCVQGRVVELQLPGLARRSKHLLESSKLSSGLGVLGGVDQSLHGFRVFC